MKPLLAVMTVMCLCVGAPTIQSEPSREPQAKPGNEKRNEEVLAPLTDAERRMDVSDIILNQPDFVADLDFFVNEGFGGFGGAERIARKGTRFREESKFWTFVGEIGKSSVRLYPQAKVYDEMVPPRVGSADGSPLNAKALALDSDITLTALGTEQIEGHKCIKIEAVTKDRPEKVYLYSAQDLMGLTIVVQVIVPKRSTVQRLHSVSLEVPDGLVEIPPDYKPIEHEKWTKLESAKLTYQGKPSKDYGVFRAPGGELFIWVNDAYYPWEYLYRPQHKTVEIEFQGLLVNASGTYIWQTKETEAFSSINYHTLLGSRVDAHLVVVPNGIKFRSNSYEQDGAMIEISW
jgi:hypothetical protein